MKNFLKRAERENKELAGPERSNSGYQREDARCEPLYHFAKTIYSNTSAFPEIPVLNVFYTSCAFFTWHKQYDSCNRFHLGHIFSSLNFFFYLFALYLDK